KPGLASVAASVASPVEALRRDEIERTRIFAIVAFALTIGGIIIALSTSGNPIAQRIVIACSIPAGFATVWVLRFTRNAAAYDARRLLVPALFIILGAMGGVYYWGAVSPIAGLLVYGIYFFSLGSDRRATTVVFVTIAVIHGALGAGILADLLEDRGLIRMTILGGRDQLAMLIIIEALYVVAFITARISQKVTLQTVSRLE